MRPGRSIGFQNINDLVKVPKRQSDEFISSSYNKKNCTLLYQEGVKLLHSQTHLEGVNRTSVFVLEAEKPERGAGSLLASLGRTRTSAVHNCMIGVPPSHVRGSRPPPPHVRGSRVRPPPSAHLHRPIPSRWRRSPRRTTTIPGHPRRMAPPLPAGATPPRRRRRRR